MSAPVEPSDVVEVAKAHAPKQALETPISEKVHSIPEKEISVNSREQEHPHVFTDGRVAPTEEEERTLRRVSDKVPWTAYTIAFVELCERFSYYGTTAVCMLRYGHKTELF